MKHKGLHKTRKPFLKHLIVVGGGMVVCILLVAGVLQLQLSHHYTTRAEFLSTQHNTIPAVLNSTSTRALTERSETSKQIWQLAQSFTSIPTSSRYSSSTISLTQVDRSMIAIELTNNETILNAGEIEVFFDPAQLIVTAINISSALCEPRFVITKEIDNKNGRIFYQCGTITPFTRPTTTLATVTVLPQHTGTSSLVFGTNTHLLAHDGKGTNVLQRFKNTFYTLK